MKSSIKPAVVKREGEITETKFGISSSEDLVYIFDILRNKLYTDKIMAVVREYSTNAADAHAEAGKPDLPIQIKAPNSLDLTFKVRDFGYGLSEEDVRNVFCMYGKSTKRESNSFTGQLGLGCKSGFSYGESFVIVSYHGGTKTTYNAYIDETRIGSIAKMSEVPTDETGIEIQISVSSDDVWGFRDRIEKIYKGFKVKPEVTGMDCSDFDKPEKILLSGDNWSIENTSYWRERKPYARMGNICYPIDKSSFETSDSRLWDCKVIIDFPIGSLNIAANREGLEYDKFTISSIEKRISDVEKSISKKVFAEIDNCTCLSEAQYKYRDIVEGNQAVSGLKVQWKDIDLTSYFALPKAEKSDDTKSGRKEDCWVFSKNGDKITRTYSHHLHLRYRKDEDGNRKRVPVYVSDRKPGWMKAARYLTEKHGTIDVITNETGFLQEIGFKTDEFPKLSDVVVPKIKRLSGGHVKSLATGDRKLMNAYLIVDSPADWTRKQSDNWNMVKVEKESKNVYIALDSFVPSWSAMKTSVTCRDFKTLTNALSNVGFDKDIYGVKTSDLKKLGSGWVSLYDWMKLTLSKNNALREAIIKVLSSRNHDDHIRRDNNLEALYELTKPITNNFDDLVDCKFKDLFNKFLLVKNIDDESRKIKFSDCKDIISVISCDGCDGKTSKMKDYLGSHISEENITKFNTSIDILKNEVLNKYPMLKYSHWLTRFGSAKRQEDYAKEVINYVNTIEKCS